jgi:hypothetical protein
VIGSVVFVDGVPQIAAGTQQRHDVWQLDLLGNWAGLDPSAQGQPGVPAEAGRWSTAALDSSGSAWLRHTVDAQNRVGTVVSTQPGPPGGGQGASTTAFTRHDAAGNLIFDGTCFYQYDAWNRLLQVNRAHLGPVYPGGNPGTAGPGPVCRSLAHPTPPATSPQTRPR